MFCQTCGTKLRATAQFCNKCGKPVGERFGSALLPEVKASAPTVQDGPVPAIRRAEKPVPETKAPPRAVPIVPEPLPPAPEVKAPTAKQRPSHTAQPALESPFTAPELPKPPTDQILQRGTDRQPLAKATVQESTTPLGAPPGAITNVSTKLPKNFPSPPPVATDAGFVPTPQQTFDPIAQASTKVEEETLAESVVFHLSTDELKDSLESKPFFTRLLAPLTKTLHNPQHKRLANAVPVGIAVLLGLLIFAYFFLK